ncbi:hypothetical protein H0A36_13625 [Endozoicomonas sp. SM1973]|uniref:Uncharacterized protein n=1 Tax=Spartinivicinus marinus TaxID=2994442 RepID=A0A853ICZ6_9GAMM|nr:hypothetical protein [Spartinivicinus marinus]MCX4027059.1 hypothetical protein [Spartinivicinus marinus]NYZ67055.1 hypothetical protein [Spartinivicinus marinus]
MAYLLIILIVYGCIWFIYKRCCTKAKSANAQTLPSNLNQQLIYDLGLSDVRPVVEKTNKQQQKDYAAEKNQRNIKGL